MAAFCVDSNQLERAAPADMGVCPAHICDYVSALDALHCHSLMILRRGRVITEAWWKPYRPEYPHILYSVSKSFTSVAVGFAVQEGLLSLDERVVDIFRDLFPCVPCGNLQKARVRHLLTMSLGHRGASDLDFISAKDWLREILHQYYENEPGTDFSYDNSCTFLASVIVQRRSGLTLYDYLTPRLFKPLGMASARWELTPDGYNPGGWGLRATTEDVAKFGQFLLQRGSWNGRQLLPEEWLAEATAKHIDSRAKSIQAAEDCWRGYGYYFWQSQLPGVYRADGALGQTVVVMPEQMMVVAMTAGNKARMTLLEKTWELLLPGVDAPPAKAGEGRERLAATVARLAIPVAKGEAASPGASVFSGKEYVLADNPLGITRLSVRFGERDAVALSLGGDRVFAFEAGHGCWHETATGIQLDKYSDVTVIFHPNVAASSAWEGREYVVKLAFTQTPFVDTLRLSFDDLGMLGEYVCSPDFGGRPGKTRLMGRLDRDMA